MDNWPEDWIFDAFDVVEETYKTVGGHGIEAAIMVPKKLKPGVHPVMFNYHGGFLIYGSSTLASFFSPWALQLALEKSAIIVSPNYRLIPSANGVADLLEDLEDFWKWTRAELSKVLTKHAPGQDVDLTRVLLAGNSAGGYCAIQTALSHPLEVAAVALGYPELDVRDRLLVSGPRDDEKTILQFARENIPSKEECLRWIKENKNTVRTKGGHETGPLAVGITTHGLYYSHVFDSEGLNRPEFLPLERIKAGAQLPKNMQGDDDSIVRIDGARKFIALAKEKLPETTIRLDVGVNEDHAFDLRKATWELHAIGALDFVRESWVGTQ